jgi:hypothetical protein
MLRNRFTQTGNGYIMKYLKQDNAPCGGFPVMDRELWRRAQTRREAERFSEASARDRLLLPLVLSLARLAAQRDSRNLRCLGQAS